jgi:hypothetical protein
VDRSRGAVNAARQRSVAWNRAGAASSIESIDFERKNQGATPPFGR